MHKFNNLFIDDNEHNDNNRAYYINNKWELVELFVKKVGTYFYNLLIQFIVIQ